eukprot:469493_1
MSLLYNFFFFFFTSLNIFFFATFVDFYANKQFIQKQYDKNNGIGTIIKMFIYNDQSNAVNSEDKYRRIFTGCCDISWIDKFSDETKVVFRPFATFYGYKIVECKEKYIKILLVHGRQITENDKWLKYNDIEGNNNNNNLNVFE